MPVKDIKDPMIKIFLQHEGQSAPWVLAAGKGAPRFGMFVRDGMARFLDFSIETN